MLTLTLQNCLRSAQLRTSTLSSLLPYNPPALLSSIQSQHYSIARDSVIWYIPMELSSIVIRIT